MELRPPVTVSQIAKDQPSDRAKAAESRNGCPWHDVLALLREVKLRPTRQRMALGWLLFGKGARHLTAEMLYEEDRKSVV